MANKTWTATGVEQGQLTLQMVGDNLCIGRVYTFTGASTVGHRKLRRTVAWADVPAAIKGALTSIDNWTRAEILAKEGMEQHESSE